MRNISDIISRLVIWLAAATVPLQGLPAASCACGTSGIGGISDARQTGCCCLGTRIGEGRCCCAGSTSAGAASCCDFNAEQESSCSCGIDCQCGTQRQPLPATPPAEDNAPEKVSCDSVDTLHVWVVDHSDFTREHSETSVAVSGVGALDRCALLCRFSL